MGENLLAKVTQNFRQVWGTSGDNPSHAQTFSCSYAHVQGLAKYMFAGGAKSGKISFSPLETKKTTFFAKNMMGKCQIKKSLGALLYSPTPMPLKLFITNMPREITKICLLISIGL